MTLYYTVMRGQRDDDQQTKNFNFGHDNGQGREPVKILGNELQTVQNVKYISVQYWRRQGAWQQKLQRVSAAWRNWKRCRVVLCDKRMPVKLNGKVYKT